MGGRGAFSAGGNSGVAKGGMTLSDGTTFEFDGDLYFDGDDPNLSGKARQAITGWEDKRVTAKVEYAYAIDADGNPRGAEKKGGKGSVKSPYYFHINPDGTFTHIHPRDDKGTLGGTFSSADLNNFANFSNKTCRAAAREGTYSISKAANFNKEGFKAYVDSANKAFKRDYNAKVKSISAEYSSGKITYEAYVKGSTKAFNTALVGLHETYRAGQSAFGYTYTLEKRR